MDSLHQAVPVSEVNWAANGLLKHGKKARATQFVILFLVSGLPCIMERLLGSKLFFLIHKIGPSPLVCFLLALTQVLWCVNSLAPLTSGSVLIKDT